MGSQWEKAISFVPLYEDSVPRYCCCRLFSLFLPVSQQHVPNRGKCVNGKKSWSGIQGQHRLIKMVELLAFINSSATVNLSPGQDKRVSFTLLICSGLCRELPSLPHHFCSIPKENSPVFLGSSHSNLPLSTAFWKSKSGKERSLSPQNLVTWAIVP